MSRSIEHLYRRYAPMVHRRCVSILGDENLAEDAMHDVFARAIESYAPHRVRYPSSLLYRMATNHCLNILRREARLRYANDVLDIIVCYEESYERIEVRDVLRHMFSFQKPDTRVMAYMYYVDDMSLSEIADEFGMSVPGVKKRLSRLRQQIASMKEDMV